MQKFNSINLESKFIKNILQNTYIPTIPIVNDGDLIVSGAEYCYKNQLIKCENTGILIGNGNFVDGIQYVPRSSGEGTSPSVSDNALCSPDFICGVGIRSATYDVITKLNSHTHIPGLTHKYKSSTPKYDAETHRYLGVYLRWYRDVYGIDLLSLYNCFCGESYTLAQIKDNQLADGYDSTKSVNIVPIQLNKRYTIFINSPHRVSMCGAFLNHHGRILSINQSENQYLDELIDNEVKQLASSSYNQPIEYEMTTTDTNLLGYSNQFYLLIQTEAQQFCPIVVLEGSYNRLPDKFITSRETYTDDTGVIIDYSLFKPVVQSSMSLVPTSYHIPYSHRLIEFLTENAVTNAEDIPKNIARVQNALGMRDHKGELTDVWSDELRFIAYNEYFKYSCNHHLTSKQLDAQHNPTINLNLGDRGVYSKAPEFTPDTYYVEVDDVYKPLKSKPSNWDTHYGLYYTYTTIDGFKPIASLSTTGGSVVGLKNCKSKRTFENNCDITGYIDKDVEDKLFGYRSV